MNESIKSSTVFKSSRFSGCIGALTTTCILNLSSRDKEAVKVMKSTWRTYIMDCKFAISSLSKNDIVFSEYRALYELSVSVEILDMF